MSLFKWILFQFTVEKIFTTIIASDIEPYNQPVILQTSTLLYDQSLALLNDGQTLYIKGIGFDSLPSNNQVFIGNNSCIIFDQGVKGIYLECITTQSKKETTTQVLVGELIDTYNQLYSDVSEQTPILYSIVPRSNFAGRYSYWTVSHIPSTNTKVVEKMKIDQYLCHRLNLINYNEESIPLNTPINCQVPVDIEAGKYQVSMKTNSGTPIYPISQQNINDNGTYQTMIVPQINRMLSSTSQNGQIIEIYGSGFSDSPDRIQLNQNFKYSIISSTKYKITAFIHNNNNITIGKINDFYISGSGLKYRRYNLADSGLYLNEYTCIELRKKVLNNQIPIIDTGTYLEPQTINNMYNLYGQFWDGLFLPPYNGTYRFYIYSNDCSQVWFNLNPNSLNVSEMIQVAGCYWYTPNNDYLYEKYNNPQVDLPDSNGNYKPGQIGIPLNLTQGNYYQIQIFHSNMNGVGYLTTSVRFSNQTVNNVVLNSMPETHVINFTYFPTAEVVVLIIYNADDNKILNGTYQLKFGNTYTRLLKADQDNSSLSQNLYWDLQYKTTIFQEPLDKYGISNNISIAGYRYTIVIRSWRKDQIIPIFRNYLSGGTVIFKFEQIIKPTPPISGTYQVAIDGIIQIYSSSPNLPYNFDLNYRIKQRVLLYYGKNVKTYMNGTFEDGFQLYVTYTEFKANETLPNITIVQNNLKGGINDTVLATVSVWIPRNNDTFFQPIPSEMLFQYSDQPQLNVYVNGVLGVCDPSACDLNTSTLLKVNSFSRQNNTINMVLTYTGFVQFYFYNIEIEHAGIYCLVSQKTYSFSNQQVNLNCNLIETILEAGNYLPKVFIDSIGYAMLDPSIQIDIFNLTVSQIIANEALKPDGISPIDSSISFTSSLNISQGGGTITIKGSGFPSNPDRSNYTLDLNNTKLQVISMNNSYILVDIPPQNNGTYQLNFQFNNFMQSFNLNIEQNNQVTISSVTTSIQSNQSMFYTIQGANFGQIASEVYVQLVENKTQFPKIFDLNIISINDNQVIAYENGAHLGNYNVRIWRKLYGCTDITQTNDDYINEVNITDCFWQRGSMMGGAQLNITGNNFIEDETQVFIGEAVNKICSITSLNKTSIICITPIAYPEYSTNQSQQIHVVLRSNIQATDRFKCNFIYTDKKTPQITLPANLGVLSLQNIGWNNQNGFNYKNTSIWSHSTKFKGPNHWKYHFYNQRNIQYVSAQNILQYQNYSTGTTVSISGNFTQNYNVSVFIGSTVVVAQFINSSTVQFTFPSLIQGLYQVRLLWTLDPYNNSSIYNGYSTQSWIAKVDFRVNNISSGISSGGSLVNFTGTGFRESIMINLIQGFNNIGKCLVQVYISPELIQCQTSYINITVNSSIAIVFTQYDSTLNSNSTIKIISNIFIPQIKMTVLEQIDSSGVYQINLTTNQLTLNLTSQQSVFNIKNVSLIRNQTKYLNSQIQVNNNMLVTFDSIPSGIYMIEAMYDDYNFVSWSSNILQINAPQATIQAKSLNSIAGSTLTINGLGFSNNSQENTVSVCGFNCLIEYSNYSQIICNTQFFLNNFTFLGTQWDRMTQADTVDFKYFDISADNQSLVQNLIDKNFQTDYYSSVDNCSFQFDIKNGYQLVLKYLRFSPSLQQPNGYDQTAIISYSLDSINYQVLMVNKSDIHQGWNYIVPNETILGIKSINLTDPFGAISTSCAVSEIEFIGWVISSQDAPINSDVECPVNLTVNGNNIPVNGTYNYSYQSQITISSMNPIFGSRVGGTTLTITLKNYNLSGTDIIKVQIDKIPCLNINQSNYTITCETGPKNDSTDNTGLEISINGQNVYVNVSFIYADLYSNVSAWNGGLWPQEGDTIFIPEGQILIIDQTPPKLNALLVEGGLTFLDDPTLPELKLDLNYLIIREGKFWIGSEDQPFQRKLTITLYGDPSDKQLSIVGSKVIGCISCRFDIHGNKPSHYYTYLSNTTYFSYTSILVEDLVNWQVGQEIVIASSSVYHNHSEIRTIDSINSNQIKFKNPFRHNHYSYTETYGNFTFPMKVEVGLLTRNIIIQGDPTSQINNFGGHLIIFGDSIAKIENVEFINMGQAGREGRYPIHFQKFGEMIDSYIKGNSIHNSFSRCITLNGVLNSKIIENICYNAFGHMIALQQGIESKNLIQGNLMIGAKSISFNNQLYDVSPANYYITNPDNIIIGNRAAGSDYFGYLYNLDTNLNRQQNTIDNCPQGIPMGVFQNNCAHSNLVAALQINTYAPRLYPCRDTISSNDDPYSINQGIEGVFSDFTTWKNQKSGIIGQDLGDITFRNIQIADCSQEGISIHKSSLTSRGVIIVNTLLLGQSAGNPLRTSTGLVTPRSNGFLVKNITFQNFDIKSTLIKTCALCSYQSPFQSFSYSNPFLPFKISGGKNYIFTNLTFNNSENATQILKFDQNYKDIIWDLDGSLSSYILKQSVSSSFIIPPKQYIEGCQSVGSLYQICTQQIRDVHLIYNSWNMIYTHRVQDNENFSALNISSFQQQGQFGVGNDFVLTPMLNYTYHIFCKEGAFSYIEIQQSQYWTDSDLGLILRFNFTTGSTYSVILKNSYYYLKYYQLQDDPLDTSNCTTGDYYIDLALRFVYICLSGKGRLELGQSLGVINQTAIYTWNTSLVWENHKVPKEGENGTIVKGVKVIFDCNDSLLLQDLTILGELNFNHTNSTLRAGRIFVNDSGKISAGTQQNRFNGTLNIIGELQVTGAIELYGLPPRTTWTRLSKFAQKSQNSIVILNALDWSIGDEIVIGPSGKNPEEYEKHFIKGIINNTITLDSPLAYDHYGDPNITVSNQVGDLDMRAAVGHLNRNIKIIGQVLIKSFQMNAQGVFDGVEWVNCSSQNNILFSGNLKSLVSNSVFRESKGIFINVTDNQNLQVLNNVFFDGTKAMMVLQNINMTTVANNLFIYVRKIKFAVFISHIDLINTQKYLYTNNYLKIYNNTGQGSQDSGYLLMASPCDRPTKAYSFNNTCSSVDESCFSFKQVDLYCSYIKGVKAYHAKVGAMVEMYVDQTRMEYIMVAESSTGIIIKPGKNDSEDNPNYANRIYVTALARPQCQMCYTSDICSNQVGFQLVSIFSVSPYSDLPQNLTQRIDGRMYISNSIFENFNLKQIQTCSQNVVFSPNIDATDSTSQHYLQKTQCIGCEINAYFLFLDPQVCGTFECTGQENILVTDLDGSFFGQPAQVFSNNPYITKNLTLLGCTRKESWNGYFCNGTPLTSLLWQSVAPDSNRRIFSPVMLLFQSIQNVINSPKERLSSQFNAIVMVNSIIEMTNTGENPTDAHFWLSRRRNIYQGGSPNDYVIIQLSYSEPLSIVVSTYHKNQSEIIKPFITTQTSHANLLGYSGVCGANNYFKENNTIHFVVTGEISCYVRVRQANSVFVSSTLNVSLVDFQDKSSSKSMQNWIQTTSKLLNVSLDSIKIVNISQNQTLQIQWVYEEQTPIGIDGVDGYNSSNITSNLYNISLQAQSIANDSVWENQLGYSNVVQNINVQYIPSLNFTSPEPPKPPPEQVVQLTYDTNYGKLFGITIFLIIIL